MATTTEIASASPRPDRATRIGLVTADSRDKTIRVDIPFTVRHAKYGKYLHRATRLHVHDEKNEARIGDTVEIAACRPISRTKSWRLVRVVKKGGGGA